MKDRPPDDCGTSAAPGAQDGPPADHPPRPAAQRAIASAYLELWDRNQSDLARRGPGALTASAAAAAAKAQAEAEAALPHETPAPPSPNPSTARVSIDPLTLDGAIAPHRRGRPSPLLYHLGVAAASAAQGAALAPLAGDPRFPWTDLHAERGTELGAQLGPDPSWRVAREALRHITQMTQGVDAWQRHPWRRETKDPPILWRRGTARILDYGATAEAGRAGRPVLVVPSLVNRAYVLDLHPRRSMLRFLAAQGLRPLLLDWGVPGLDERDFSLSDYVRLRLAPALEAARMLSPDGAAPAALGYCMGGSLAAAIAAAGRDRISRLALIGAPWDFSCLQGVGKAMVTLARADDRTTMGARLDAIGAQFGTLPVDALQLVFAALDPTLAFRKFRAFAALPQDGPRAEMFAATEDWLNDGVTLTIPAARELLFDWYLDNAMGRGRWAPEGIAARPRAIAAPVLAFCSRNDRIAPGPCAEALPAAIPHARILRPTTGHVGMIIGGSAEREVWRPLAAFLSAD